MYVLDQIDMIDQYVTEQFLLLSPAQLNWKPEPTKWSIGQCLEHLITSNSTYFPSFEKLIYHRYKLSFFQKINPFKKLAGPLLVRSMGSGGKGKFKAPKIFQPTIGSVSSNIVQEFLQHQQLLKTTFQRLLQLDTKNLVIASPISGFITYTLSDAMDLLIVHEKRHINQAQNVLAHPNFSK